MKKSTIIGFVAGSIIFGSIGAFAGQYVATENPFPVKLNGNDVQIQGYNIEGSTYFKLRDIADVIGGFEVGFNNDTIQLSKDGYVYETVDDNLKTYTSSGFSFKAPNSMTKEDYDGYSLFQCGDCYMDVYTLNKGETVSWSSEFANLPINDIEAFENMRYKSHTWLSGQDCEDYIADSSTSHINASNMTIGQFDFVTYDLYEDDVDNSPNDISNLPHRQDHVKRYYTFEHDGVFYEIGFSANLPSWSEDYIKLMDTVINSIEF